MITRCNNLGVPDAGGSIWVAQDVPSDLPFPVWDGAAWRSNPAVYGPADALPTLEDYDRALTAHLDAEAQTHRYEDRISCSVRAGYVGPFQAEGIAFAQWMDACNATGYSMLADFQNGVISQPTIAEMIAALPVMVWP